MSAVAARLVVVGATGAVGTEMLSILHDRGIDPDRVVAVASPRSAGRRLAYGDDELEVVALAPDVFSGDDIALFDVPDEVSREWAPVAVERGAVVVDNSAAWRMDPEVPLVVPEINPRTIENRSKGIIASPNCTTLAAVVPLAVLHERATLERVIASSYQAASGAGKIGVDDLWDQIERAAKEPEAVARGLARDVLEPGSAFAHPIALNVIPQCGSARDDGFTSEELKLCYETRKILGLPDLAVTATCVRVPVVVGHGVSVHAWFAEPLPIAEARAVLAAAPGVELMDDLDAGVYPTPLQAAGRDPCYVGRIRRDPFDEFALTFFTVADNLRKGAALNTVQVAELLIA